VPDHASFVADHSTVDLVLLYGLYGDGAGAARDLRYVPQDRLTMIQESRQGRPVFLFDRSRELLTGFGVEIVPVPLRGLNVLTDICEWTHGETVILAGLPAEWWRDHQPARPCFAVPDSGLARRDEALVVTGRTGNLRGQVGPSVSTAVPAEAGAPAIAVTATVAASSIRGAGPDLTCEGCALYAVVRADGTVVESRRLFPEDDYRVPFRDGLSTMYRVTRAAACEALGNAGWIDVRTLMTTGVLEWRVDNYRPFSSSFDLVVAASPNEAVAIGPLVKTDGPPQAIFEAVTKGAMPPDPGDGWVRAMAGLGPLTWLHVDVHDNGDFIQLRLPVGGAPRVAWARATVDLNNPRRAIVCDAR
jgi:hypothetical protein